jgi:hypothetical protein
MYAHGSMKRHEYGVRWVVVALIAASLAGCKNGDNVTGPATTPTPVPSPLSGSWSGSFGSDHPVLCDQESEGTATADLTEAGSLVTGPLTVRAGACAFTASLALTRRGSGLNGTATVGDNSGPVTGALSGSELQLTLGILQNPQGGYVAGGSATMHRP